jgi:hypothetical protein
MITALSNFSLTDPSNAHVNIATCFRYPDHKRPSSLITSPLQRLHESEVVRLWDSSVFSPLAILVVEGQKDWAVEGDLNIPFLLNSVCSMGAARRLRSSAQKALSSSL